MNDVKIVKLKDILSSKEIKEVAKFLDAGDIPRLRKYLSARRKKLLKKGVLPEYLAFYLEYVQSRRIQKHLRKVM